MGVYHAAAKNLLDWSLLFHMLEQSFFLWDYLLNAIWNSDATLIHFMTVFFIIAPKKSWNSSLQCRTFSILTRFFLYIINFLPGKYFRRILVEILAYWRAFISFLFKFATSSYNGPNCIFNVTRVDNFDKNKPNLCVARWWVNISVCPVTVRRVNLSLL